MAKAKPVRSMSLLKASGRLPGLPIGRWQTTAFEGTPGGGLGA